MKNVFVLPTDKPSRLISSGKEFNILNTPVVDKRCKNIYITSDEEITGFENNIWVYNNDRVWLWQNMMALVPNNKPEKIILTTDQDLIKDGVQAIDDEFLEWFVNNSSCKCVEVKNYPDYEFNMYGYYEIIIPKEDPKQENKKVCKCKRAYENPLSEICSLCWNELYPNEKDEIKDEDLLESKQETLEEAAERFLKNGAKEFKTAKQVLIEFAKWQQERMYSEEEVLDLLKKSRYSNYDSLTTKEWFEQYKKK